ncbi:Putative oligosaccaryltransferase, oligosaccharyltransferase subunit ost4p superfamily [Septoria linicola]|uniref:Dolichyl-diphosphooligosaccharide--protein glycosyltransferase subunit 4 n=1 Tax=Septoria linicola TaxID=215465 RepID=A0A9Q9B495_9PEZI|nr:putative oligosaccaryltransferase, oligosaccharyltransferase subunit ost4p superfamily [Septoria linicola]USW57208.1 Putative oligosaccaryltransferase, oligosaccharyltransferase subunit ost4p superfamily [Septoria linicola]
MISDSQLYSLALFLGAAAMLMIVVYHFLEVNSDEHQNITSPMTGAAKTGTIKDSAAGLAGKLNADARAGGVVGNGRSVAQ